MGVEKNKQVAERDVLCVGKEMLEEKLGYYTPDAVVWDSVIGVLGYASSNTVSGFKEVKAFFTWLANLPPVGVKIQNIFGEGDKVAVEWLLRGGEGERTFEIPCANIYDFENGKIKSVRMQFDSAAFARIVGK
jgi:predicted ester cyclase